MIFGNQLRSTKAIALVVASVVFLAALFTLAFNHLEIQLPYSFVDDLSSPFSSSDRPPPNPKQVDFYLKHIQKPSVKPDSKKYRAWDAFEYALHAKPHWTKPLREKLCIIDLDNRPWSEPGELWGPKPMSWDQSKPVHGLSLGVLNHWVYAKIHGYKYYFIDFEEYNDRRASWKKPTIMAKILEQHDVCLFLDSDAIFHHLDLPFEWLMNYWDVHADNNSLALAFDPEADNNKDEFGTVYLNTGFIIAQNNEKTFEIMREWNDCAEEGGTHPDCVNFRLNRPGKPTDQGGFGTYIRYDYPDDIKSLPCDEANGFPESNSGCNGLFIRHLWTGKKNWIKSVISQQMPGGFLEMLHTQYLKEKPWFYQTEKELMSS
ncbi:hypothetical protein B0I35DRAFT_471536 [Stachybotrys elegans]|uniref:Nucleotide-diphospho-sugar transferase domain-containing protein n=1 Tax=Stachybotrys elegans TaxID=80388 RepID=A0A8K0SGY8_9HYPO|nr:hypothetical protein B0I35DRAFT_471536 [Stachybotrys elegans]